MWTPTQRRDHRNNACIGAKSCDCSARLAASDPERPRRRHIPKWSRSIGCGQGAKLRTSARLSSCNDDRGRTGACHLSNLRLSRRRAPLLLRLVQRVRIARFAH